MWYNIIIQIKDGDPKTQRDLEMTQQQMNQQKAKYNEYRQERLSIFETLMKMGVTKEQLEKASETFNVLSEGNADVMIGLWRDLANGMSQ